MILLFCAFAAEARPLRALLARASVVNLRQVRCYQGEIKGVPVSVVLSGIGMAKARIAAQCAMDAIRPAAFVVITGVAGALAENLAVGQIVVAERLLIGENGDFRPAHIVEVAPENLARITSALHAAGIDYCAGSMLTTRRPLAHSSEKRRVWRATGAIGVDMESAAIAREAEHRGIPFACIRSVLDTAAEDVPVAELVDDSGRVNPMAAVRTLITKPRMVIEVAQLMRNLRRATDSMAAAAAAVIPHLV